MLPTGPRSTFRLPSTVQPGSRELARQILASINAANVKANEVRTGLVTTGCDGQPVVNPLDGTNCNGSGGTVVLFNPATRKVFGTLGKISTAGPATVATAPALACATVMARLRTKRRFTDNLGNVYGPDGAWLSSGNAPAQLGTDYIHRLEIGTRYKNGDPPTYPDTAKLQLEKTTGVARVSVTFTGAWDTTSGDREGLAQGTVWPSVNDTVSQGMVTIYSGHTGLDDALCYGASSGTRLNIWIVPRVTVSPSGLTTSGTFTGSIPSTIFDLEIDSTGAIDTFKWRKNGGAYTTGVSCAGTPTLADGVNVHFDSYTGHTLGNTWVVTVLLGDASVGRADAFSWSSSPNIGAGAVIPITGDYQTLAEGFSVRFGATNGHGLGSMWFGIITAGNNIVRPGVAVRGRIEAATACVNGGFPNNNVLLTTELVCSFPAYSRTPIANGVYHGSHALVVRDPDSLALLYRKALDHDTDGYAWGDPPEKFCFSTNDEGLFFMHCYTTPSLASPPTPYPGHEFGAPNPRKIAVVSVNPLTFEPTITELITLADTSFTSGSSFAVASTLP